MSSFVGTIPSRVSQALNVSALLAERPELAIGDLEMDAVVVEQHSFENMVAQHPVHKSNEISDHKYRKTGTLTIRGVISNTPLKAVDPFTAPERAKTAWERLQQLAEQDAVLTILTTLQAYESYVITALSTDQTAQSKDHIEFTCSLREFITVETSTVAGEPQRAEYPKQQTGGERSGVAAQPQKRADIVTREFVR